MPDSRPSVDPRLLEILVCPLTKETLRYDAERQELISEKARLASQAVRMLWSPTFSVDSDEGGRGRVAELGRDVVEPVFMLAVYALALAGAFVVPRRFLVLAVLLLGYNTVLAMVFAGTVRYRAPFDFLLAILAAAALVRAWDALCRRRESVPA